MKKIILLFALTMFGIIGISDNAKAEHTFTKATFQNLLDSSAKTGKNLMIFCSTEWCSWCVKMENTTFQDPGIKAILDKNFIWAVMDMENGDGKNVAMKFRIKNYPSFIYFNAQGDYVYRSIGYEDVQSFTNTLISASSADKQMKFEGVTKNFFLDYPDFYKKSFGKRKEKINPSEKDVADYLSKFSDYKSELAWSVYYLKSNDTKYDNIFLKDYNAYKSLWGNYEVEEKLNKILQNKINEAVKTKNEKILDECIQTVEKYNLADKESYKVFFKFSFYEGIKDYSKYTAYIDEVFKAGKIDEFVGEGKFSNMCWNIMLANPKGDYDKLCYSWMKKYAESTEDFQTMYVCGRGAAFEKDNAFAKKMLTKALNSAKKANETESVKVIEKELNKVK